LLKKCNWKDKGEGMKAEAEATKVLLIDDEPDFAKLVELILGRERGDIYFPPVHEEDDSP